MATSTTNLGLIKPAGADKIRIAQINQNSDTLDAAIGAVGATSLQTQMNNVQDALAIIANGDTHPAITAGQFVYVKNNTHSVAEGLHVATANISANGQITTSNVSADASGGLNALNSNITFDTTISNLNDTSLAGGHYFYEASATGNPTTTAGRLIQIKSAASSWGGQIAVPNSSSFLMYARMKTSSGYGDWEQIAIKSGLQTTQRLIEWAGTSQATVNLTPNPDNYSLLCIVLTNANGDVVGSTTVSPLIASTSNIMIYGESSAQWGSFRLSTDHQQGILNRTSANTSSIRVYGLID